MQAKRRRTAELFRAPLIHVGPPKRMYGLAHTTSQKPSFEASAVSTDSANHSVTARFPRALVPDRTVHEDASQRSPKYGLPSHAALRAMMEI